jgi:hypothetical protein
MAFSWEDKSTVDLNDPAQLQALLDRTDKRSPMQKFFSKAAPQFSRFVDFISKPRYAIGGVLTGKGIKEGIKQKTNPSEAFGVDKDTKLFSGKGLVGFALDTVFDPTTYLGLGAATGSARVVTKAGVKVLTEAGLELPSQIVKKIPTRSVVQAVQKARIANPNLGIQEATTLVKQDIARRSADQYFERLATKGLPEAKKFFDQGGIKFGLPGLPKVTLVSGEDIAKTYGVGAGVLKEVVHKIPGGKFVTDGLETTTNTMRAAFDSTYGKNIFMEKTAVQGFRDLLDFDYKQTQNLGTQIFAGVKNEAEAKAITYVREYEKLAARYGKKLERFPDKAIRQEIIDSVAMVSKNPRLKGVLARLGSALDEMAVSEQRAGLLGSTTEDYITHLYKNKQAAATLKGISTGTLKSDLRFAKERTIETLAEAKLFGLDPELNAINIYGIRRMSSQRSLRTQELIKTAAKQFGVDGATKINKFADPEIAAKFLNDYAPFTDDAVGTVYLPQDVIASLKGVINDPITDEGVRGLLKGYDAVNNFFKGSYTSWWPAYHTRNIIGNVSNSFLGIGADALNPKLAVDAAKLTTALGTHSPFRFVKASPGAKEMINKTVFTTRFGEKLTGAQILREIETMGVDKTFFSSGELGRDIAKSISHQTTKSKVQRFLGGELGRTIGNDIETQSRIQFYLSKRLSGHTAESAAELTKNFLFDYDNLTKFEKGFMRRAIPFYTWVRKNMALQARNILSQPVKYGALAQISEKLNAGISQEDIEKLPDWIKNQPNLVQGKKGQKLLVLTNFGIPFVDAIQRIFPESLDYKGLSKKGEDILAQGAFVPKAILELAVGKDFFRHKPLKEMRTMHRDQYDALNPLVQQLITVADKGGDYVTVNPIMRKMIDALPTSRAGNTFSQLTRQDQSAVIRFLRGLTGVAQYEVSTESNNSLITKELQEELLRRGEVAEFVNLFIPKEK